MEIECDLASIRDEDLLRKMWQQSEDFGRKKEIRSHLYKLRESRLREFYSTGGPGGEIMNPATDLHFGKSPLTPSHGDSLADQSFQSLKSKEIRDSLSPTHDIKFRNSGGVAGGVLVPDTTGWNVQSSSEVSPDGRAFRTESLAKTDGVEKIPGGHAEFAGRNEQKSSASHQGDDKNYVKKAAESSKTHLQEKVVIGDENSGRTEMKSSSVTSSSKVVSSSSQQVFSSDDPGFDMEPRRLTNQDQHYQKVLQDANNSSTLHSERQQFSRNERNERQETSSSVQEESRKYVDMDKASPEYQQHVQYLMSQPGAIVSNTVEYPKPGVKMITTVKKLPDGTTVKTKRYETEASAAAADSSSISQTMKQQQQQRMSSNTTTSQKMTEKRIQDSEDVFTRLARTRDSNVPASPRNTPESPSNEDVYTRLQQSRDVNQQKLSDSIDQRSTQILRDNNQYPGSRNTPIRRPSDQVENVETISKTNRTVKKDLNQSVRSEKITSSDFIQNERDRYVIDHDSQTRRGPDGYPEALAPITPNRHGRQQPDDYPSNGYNATEVVKQSSLSKSSAKFSESRRYSTETVESYQHSENENQDYTTRGYPSNRRPIDEPQSQSPSRGRPAPDFSTHGFPSVRSDKPTHQSPSDKLRAPDEYNTTERVHTIHTDRPKPGDVSHSDSTTTTRSNYSTNETRRHVTSTNEDFSTHGFPSVRAGTPTRDSPRRPLGSDPTPGDSPRRPSGQEPPSHQARKPPTDGYSTHGFPSVKSGSPTEDSPRRPSGPELKNQGRRPTTEDFSTHGFPSVKPGRSTPTQSAPQYESAPCVDREDTVSVTSDRSNSVIYEKKIDAAHQAFARSLRCASPVEPIRRDSTSDRHTPRSSIGSIRNSYSPSKRDGRSPSHDSVTNSESSRISSATVTKSQRPTEVRRVSGPKSPIGKSAPSHVSNETIDLSLTRKITAKPSPDKTTGRPTSIKEEPVMVQPILRKKIFGATENFLASEGVIEKPIIKSQPYYQLGLSDATLPSSYSKARQQLGTTPNTSRRPHNTGEEVDTLIETATKHITTHPSSVTPRSAKNKESKPIQPETLYSKKPLTKPEGYVTLNQATEITEKQNQTTNKHVSYPHYIPSAPKADRSPSNRPTTNNLSSPAPITTTTSTTPHNAPKSTKDKVKPSSTTSPTSKPLSSPSKVDNSTPSRFTKTVKVENAINRDTTTKTRRQPELEPESELDTELLAEPEDLDEGYVPDRKGKRKSSSQRPTSDDEGFEPDSPRAGSPTSDFEYRRPEQVETYDEEDSFRKKTNRTDKKVVTNEFLNTERNVTKTVKNPEIDETKRPKDRGVEKPEGPKRPEQSGRKPIHSVDQPTGDHEPKRPLRHPKDEEDIDETSSPKDRKPSHLVNEPKKNKGPNNELTHPDENNRRAYYEKEPIHTDDKPSRPTETSRPRGTKPPLERSETFEERCRQILGMDSDTVVDRTKKTEEFIDTERTTVDSKRKPTDRSLSPKKKQPSDTVSIEDCDDDDTGTPRISSYPGGTTTTTTTVKTTRDHPRDKSPNKKEPVSRPRDHPRDQSPVGKLPKGAKPNEYDETTTIVTTTNITDDRSTSPNRKSPKVSKPSEEDDTRPRGHSPSKRPERFDETTTIKKTSKLIDESDERSKPGSRPRGHSPQETQPGEKSPNFYRSTSPQKKQPSDTVSIEDCDDDSDSPRNIRTSKTKTTTTVKPSRDHPRDKSPIEEAPTRKSPKEEFSPTENDNIRPRGRSPTERPGKVDDTTRISKTTKIIDEIDKRSTRSKPDSRPTDQSPQKTRPRDKSPTEDSDTDNRLPSSTRPKDRSPSEKRTFSTTRETTFDMDTSIRGKSPSKQPIHETSPTVDSLRDKPSSKKPTRGTSPTNDYPSDRSPTRKPVRETSPTYESPSKRSPTRKPVGGTSTDETIISSTTTTHSNVTDSNIEDRYPSYTPKNYPRDRSPSDKQKPKAPTTEEDVEIETSKKAKKISTEEIHDDVFEVNRPRQRQPDTRDGAFISHPRDQSPSKPETLPGTEKIPRDRSPQKPKIKETEEVISKRTTKKTSDTTIENEFTDKSPTSSPRAYPRDRSPNKKPTTDETEEYRGTTKSSRDILVDREPTYRTPQNYPRDRSPVHDLTRPTAKGITETQRVDKKTVINEFLDTERRVDRPQRLTESKPIDRSPERLTSTHPREYPDKKSTMPKTKGPTTAEINVSTITKSTKSTRDTTTQDEVEEVFPSSRPRDRSPSEKPIRSPRIVTTETTTEYGIRSRPRSQSPSEKPKNPLDSEEIDETYVQETKKITEKSKITTDLDADIEKPSRRPRPKGSENKPREKSPQKPKSSDRSPSPRSKYPKDQGPRRVESRPQSRSPVGKQPKTTGSPRKSSPSEKSRIYQSTDEKTNLVKKSKTTKVTTTSEDAEDVDFETRPLGRSPSEKPRVSRPITSNQSPRDQLRGPSPTKKPEVREPTERDYEETVVKRTNKTTRNETTLEDKTERSPRDRPRQKSPSSKPTGIKPREETFEDCLPKSPRESSPSEKSRPKDYHRERSPSDKPRKPILNEEFTIQTTLKKTTTLGNRSPKHPREPSPSEKPRSGAYPHDRAPSDKPRKPGMIDETIVESTTTESTTIKDRLSKSPRGTSPTEQPGSRDYPRERSPTDTSEKPRRTSPSEKPGPGEYPRDRSPTDKSRMPRLYDETVVGKTTSETTTIKEYLSKSPRGTSPTDKPGSRDYHRDRSPTDTSEKPRRTSPSEKPGPREYPRDRSPTDTSTKPRRTSPSEKPGPREYPRDRSPTDKSRMPRLYDETLVGKTTSKTTTIKEHLSKSPRGTSPTEKPGSRDYPRERSPTDTSEKPRRTSPSEKPGPREYPRDRSPTDTSEKPRRISPSEKPGPREYPRDRSPTDKSRMPRLYDETVVGKTTSETTIIKEHLSKSPRGTSPTEKPGSRDYPRLRGPTDTSEKPRRTSPSEKPGPREYPRDRSPTDTSGKPRRTSPSEKPGPREYPRDRSPTDTSEKPRRTSPSEKPGPREYPRERSPTDKSRMPRLYDETVVGKTTFETITTKEHLSKSPRGTYPTDKPGSRDYPRDRSPTDKSRMPRLYDETLVGKTASETTIIKEHLSKSPRGTSPTDKPGSRDYPRDRSPTDTSGKPRRTSPSEKPSPREYPRDRSPTDKSRMPRLYDETLVGKTASETTIIKEHLSKSPRGTSPIEKPGSRDYPRERSPTDTLEKPRRTSPSEKPDPREYSRNRSPTDTSEKPRRTSPSEKPGPRKYPRDRSPTDKSRMPRLYDETVVGKTTSETTIIKKHLSKSPRGTSPTEKPGSRDYPRERSPTDTSKKPRRTSPSEKPGPREYPRERSPTDTSGKPRRTSPSEKPGPREYPRDRSPTDTSEKPRRTSPSEKPGPREYPRDRSPTDKSRMPRLYDETVVGKTTSETTIIKEHLSKSPRGTSPTDKPGSRDYPRDRSPTDTSEKPRRTSPSEKPGLREYPRDRSPTDTSTKPRRTSPSEKPGPREYPRDRSPTDKSRMPRLYDETVIGKTNSETTTIKEHLVKSPRGTSPTDKPGSRNYPRDRSPTDTSTKPIRTSPSEKPSSKVYPRDRSPTDKFGKPRPSDDKYRPRGSSPTEKPGSRQPRPAGESIVKRTVNTTTVDDRITKTPRGSSPIKTSPRERSPTQKPTTVYDRSPKDSPRRTSPSEKPTRRQPTVSEVEKTVQKTTSKFSKERATSEKIIVRDHPRRKSPSEKPRRHPTSDEETDDEVTETVIAVYTIDGEKVKNHPRDVSPSGKPKHPSEYYTKRPQTNGDSDHPREIYPAEKPRRHQPTDDETEETFTLKTSKLTNERKTFEEIDIEDEVPENRSPKDTYPGEKPKSTRDQPRETSPSTKPRGRQPTDESIDITVVEKTSRRLKGETTLEDIEYQFSRDRPRDRSPSKKPTGEDIDETVVVKSYKKTPFDDDKSPLEGPRTTEETVLYTTRTTLKTDDHPRVGSPSHKPGTKTYPRDRSPTDKPGDKSPLDKPRQPRPSRIEDATNRTTTVRKTVQETDFEKRYPKGRPGDQSPIEKPSTFRRPSKLSSTTTTTTTRNRSTLDEQDINRTQRLRTQPSTRDKVPTKTTLISSPRTQPTTERRIPAELPSPVRKPKSTLGTTTKTTTVTRLTGPSRPKPTSETPKKSSKLPLDSRPSARPTNRKPSPSISPDSSPSRPGSDVEIDSPYRSPNMSPSRKSPSPTRSVKLEDITTTFSTTKKATVSIDKSKPKVTHVTTAKFQVTPPTSPTKVISSPEMKFSPSSKKPSSKVPTSKPNGTKFVTDTTTTKKVTSRTYKEGLIPTDSERDSEVPSDAEEVDSILPQKPSTRKLPVTERKESAPVHRVTKLNKDVQMSRSTSENIIKTPISKRPNKHEPLEPQREDPRPTVGDRSSPKTERRPSKHLSTKTINLTTFDKVINSEDMENVIIDIQHAKSSREPSPNKIVPTPVSIDVYTGKPRYPDVVQEPEDEPKKKPNVKNIPIFEEETNDFFGCQITEVSEETRENTLKARTTKFIEKESSPKRQTPKIVTGDNVDSECLLSVHDKVSKFISTAEEVSKPKTSAPFRRDVPEKDMPEDDECLLTVDEKVSKFLKTADSVTKEVVTSKPRRMERPSIEDLDEDLKTDECVLSVSEKVNKFTTKAEKLGPSAPQRSPELVARIERQISRQSDVDSESPEGEESPVSVRKFKPSSPLTERSEKKYTERQIDILSRPSVWEKKPKPDVKLDDIIGLKPEEESRRENLPKTYPHDGKPKPVKTTDSVSKRKELFENKVSTHKTTTTTKQSSPEKLHSRPVKSSSDRHPSDDSDSKYPSEFLPQYVDGYVHQEPDDDVHEDVYGSSRTRHIYEASNRETIERCTERSPTRKSSQPDNRPTTQTPTKSRRQPEDNTPSRRYSEDHSPRYPTRDQSSTDRYTETSKTSGNTTRRRSSTQEYPERRTPYNGSHSPLRKQPVEEPEDYTFSSRRDKTTTHHTTAPRSPKDSPLNQTSFLDDEEQDHSPARSTSTVSSHKQVTTHRSTSKRLTEDITSRRPRRPSGNEPTTPTSANRTPRGRAVPETVAARRNIFEKSPGDISPMPTNRRPSYMEPTKSSLEHRKDSLEITKTNYSRKSSIDEEPYEPSPRTSVKFGVGLKHKEEPKSKRKLSSSDIPNIEDVFELELLEEMLNIVTLYEQRRRIRAQIRVVKKLLETKTKEEVSRMTKITTIRKTSSPSVRESPTPKRETPVRSERYQLTDDDIDSESLVESRHVEEHEEIIRERSISPKTKTSKIVTKVTEVRKIGEPSTPNKRTPLKKDEPKDSKPIWATKNILKKPSDNEKVTRALSAKKTTSTSSSSMSRTQQTQRQRVSTDDDCVTSSYGIGPTDEDGRPLFGIRALKKKTTTNNTVQPSETTKVTGTVITEKYYSENGAEPVGERKVTVYSTNPEDLVDMETQYDRRDSETVKREQLSKDGVTTVTKVQKIGKYKPGEIPSLTDEAEFTKATSKMVRRGSVKEMSEKFIRKESSSSVTEKSSGYPKAGLILRTRTNSGATADAADQYEVRAKSTEYDYDSEDDVEIRSSRKHSKVVAESEDETEIRRKINTRSFLNSAGSKVTGVDDVLDRMRNADNVVVDGDTLEDREARSLLNKFLGASVLMSGMESMVPQMELRKTTTGADNKQEVKTTRVTKTIKSGTTGESSSSPVARETCDFEEIWDEEILKQLLEKSTSYEERRSIRARLRQLMADREACAELKAGAKAELNETKVKTSTTVADDESSGSEYEEIIEEYTASEDDDEDEETTTATTVIAEKQNKNEVKGEKSTKQIKEEIQKTTITKKEEPKSVETKKTIVVETTTVIEEDASSASGVGDKKLNAKEEETKINNDDDGDSDSVSDSKGESLLIPLLQGLLHKNMPQARSSSGSSSKTATNSATTSNQNSNNLKSSLKANNTHISSTSKSNNNNSLGDSGLSSEVSKNNSLGQKQNGSSLRVAAPQQIEDSGTESGEDLRLIAAGIRDSMQIEGIENHSDMSLIKEVTNALNKLESSLKEGKDLALDSSKKSTLLALVERLQTGLTAPDKLSSAVGEQDFPDETSSPEADNHRSNRQRFSKRKNRNNRHTVGVSKEELADARRYIEEMVMIENLSNCTTPECNAATTPPELFTIQKQHSTGAILSSHEPQEQSAGLFRPNQFVPNNLKHSTEAGSAHPDIQLRQKKGTPGPGQRQSTGDMNSMKVLNSDPNNGKRPLSDSFDSYTAQNNRVTFSDPKPRNDNSVEEKNEYNRSHHSDDKPNNLGRLSPDSSRLNRFNNKKQLMKRANTIDIPKTHRYNPEFDTDSDFEERSALHTKGLRGTLQVTVKRKPRQVVPNFEPKTENDHKFLAFIQKQSTTTGLGWNSSKSVSNWTNKFGNIKNVFESGANVSSSNRPKTSGPPAASSAKSFWKKSEEQQNPQKTSTSVLTSALKAKERNEKRGDVVVPKPIHLNKFSHNPQSAFRPVDTSPETIQMQFKPIPMEKPSNVVVNSRSPTKTYNPARRQALESPHYSQSSPTKSWIKKNTATNSPVTLPWTVKPPENNVLKIAATKFESQSPVQRHQSFKQQEKRPSLPNTSYPYQYQDYGHSQQSYVSNSQQTSYAEYPQQPRIFRESSLTNPQAEPLILTSNAPAYSPHSLQPFDYYADDMNQNVHQTDMTDDDIDDMESMTEYRVEAKVMGKPLSQQAVTVGKRTSHMSDDEVFGKNSRAAKNLLSVMKNIGNGKPDRSSRKPEKKQASACISPNGSAYQAPIVEPLFPEITKFEANRDPEYIGQKNKQQAMGYHQNPAYVPLEDYQQKEPPVAPPRGRKLSQETKKGSAYIPKERPNIYQPPRRDAPSSLPIQAGPTSPPRYIYSSPIKSPDSSSVTSQILTDGMYMQNVPAFRKPHSEPNTPSDYSASNEAYFNQYGQMQKSYPTPQPRFILPQIPLETSYTKVYDQPRDVASLYQPPVEHPNVSAYVQGCPLVQQNSQPSIYIPPEYQQKPEPSQQYYQSPKVQHSPLPQEYAPQQAYPPRAEVSPEYYHSPKVQQIPQPSSFVAQQQAYQPRVEVPQEYYQAPKTQQVAQPYGVAQESVHLSRNPVTYYQSPQIQSSPQPQIFAPQYADTPQVPYDKSPKVPQSPRSDVPSSYYQSPKTQQSPQQPTSSTEIPFQYPQSPKLPQVKPSTPQQVLKYPIMNPQSQHSTPQTYQSSKTQQNSQPMSPLYQPKAPVIQAKPQVTPKNESVTQSSKSQYSSSSYHQQQIQSIVTPTRSVEQQAPNAAVLCKQASLEGRKRVQSQSQKYEQVEEIRRKSLGNVLEITRDEREAQEQKAAAIKQDMYSVQQDVYSQQKSIQKKTEVHQQDTKVAYKSSAPDDTPDIVKSSLKKDDIPILKKFGPPQRHCYMPNAYQNPLMKSETTVMNKTTKTVSRKFSDPSVSRGPLIVEIPSTPQPDSQDEIPRNIVFNKISAFTSMSRKQAESSTEYTSQQSRPNKLSKCDSWHQICQLQSVPKPPSPRFNTNGNAALRRSKSGHTLALPKLYEATYDRAQISEKQRTVAAYFTGQKSPNSLSRNSSQTNLAEESNYVSVKKSSINRIKTSEKASIGRQDPSSGLSRSHTMPQIANVNLLDESNVEDAFEQLMNGLSTTTTEKTETKNEDGGVVTTTTKVTTRTITGAPKPVSPFAKFQQLDKQNSLQSPKSPLTPTTPGGSSSTPIFRFTDPALNARAATFKEQLLQWCQSKTQEYENVQITNFSASWTDGLAFCALIHHFLPDAFDYSKLNAKQRRYNFELAFRVADEKAGIAPLLDVEDMVVMKRPDWKCVFTYVQSIYRRFRNCQ